MTTFPQLRVRSQYAPLAGMVPLKTAATMSQPACVTDPNLWAQVRLNKAASGCHLPATELGESVVLARGESGWRQLRALASRVGEQKTNAPDLSGLDLDHLTLLGPPDALSSARFGARWAEIAPTMGEARALATIARARETGLRVAVTSGASYTSRKDASSHAVLLAIAGKRQVDRALLTRLDGEVNLSVATADPLTVTWGHLADRDELRWWLGSALGDLGKAGQIIDGTDELAASLGATTLGFGGPCMPDLLGADGLPLTAEQQAAELVRRSRSGVVERGGGDEHMRRLEEELEVINSLGYAGYFLTVADIIAWAKSRNIAVGPGRGSAPGSVCVWALGITLLDPVTHGMLFERFMNRERVSYPDIDLDFDKRRRDEVIGYLRDRYGVASVGRILNLKPMIGKTALKDVGRAFGLGFGELNALTAGLPNTVSGKPPAMSWLLENVPALREPRYAEVAKHAAALEGCIRESSVHASGVVVSRGPLSDWAPTCRTARRELCAQWGWEDVEAAGLVKFDLLGLTTVTHLDIAEQLIRKEAKHDQPDDRWAISPRSGGVDPRRSEGSAVNAGCVPEDRRGGSREREDRERVARGDRVDGRSPGDRTGVEFSLADIPLDDPATYQLIARADTLGVFQLCNPGMRRMLQQLKPDKFGDIVAAVALWRPGPIQGGMVKSYMDRKHGREPVKHLHDALEFTTGSTYGTLCYQEQIMSTCRILAGYTLGSADLMRRAMHKKRPEEMAQHREKFISGCVSSGSCDPGQAGKIFDFMSYFAGYGFNKSVDKDTLIRDALGNERKIIDFEPGDLVLCVDGSGCVTPTRVVAVHDHGEIDGHEVEFSDGSKVICSLDHKFLTPIGQVPAWTIALLGLEVLGADSVWRDGENRQRRADSPGSMRAVPETAKESCVRPTVEASDGQMRSKRERPGQPGEPPERLPRVPRREAEKHIRQDAEAERRQRGDARAPKADLRISEKNLCPPGDPGDPVCQLGEVARGEPRAVPRGVERCDQEIWREEQVRTGASTNNRLAICADKMWSRAQASGLRDGERVGGSGWILSLLREKRLVSWEEQEGPHSGTDPGSRRDAERRGAKTREHLPDPPGNILFSLVHGKIDVVVGTLAPEHAPIEDTRGLVRRSVVRISFVGKRRMYDLEVSASTHNYILPSGIVTSNSHSTVYALTAYWTAYIKAHHPVEFYAAWLSTLCEESDRFKKIAEAVYDLRERGLTILPPDVNASRRDFKPVRGILAEEALPQRKPAARPTGLLDLIAKRAQEARRGEIRGQGDGQPRKDQIASPARSYAQIRYGLAAIRGLGNRALSEILAGAPFLDMTDLLRRARMTRRDLEALIGSGACDGVLSKSGYTRADAAASLDALIKWASSERNIKQAGRPEAPIFVFGSNLAGRHGAGAAKTAVSKHGAIYGCGEGIQGRSYAIPTKDHDLNPLPLTEIANAVSRFIDFARSRPEMRFQVTRVGCGLAGYSDAQIAPMFSGAPENCDLPDGWEINKMLEAVNAQRGMADE